MNLYDIIEIIKLSEQRGKELLIDSLIIGVEIGRRNISDINDIKAVIHNLKNLKQKIDNSLLSPYIRDNIYDRIINQKENLAEVLYSFQNTFRRLSQQYVSSDICQICNQQNKGNIDMKTIKMKCNHIFHQQCVLPHLSIENQIFPAYKCPLCENQTLRDELLNQLQNNTSQLVSCCPTPQCKALFLFQGQEMYRCSNCKKKYCLKCRSSQHEINQCKIKIDQIQFKFGDNYKECPNCKQWTQTSQFDGIIFCNNCKSNICLGCADSKCNSCKENKGLMKGIINRFKQKQN